MDYIIQYQAELATIERSLEALKVLEPRIIKGVKKACREARGQTLIIIKSAKNARRLILDYKKSKETK